MQEGRATDRGEAGPCRPGACLLPSACRSRSPSTLCMPSPAPSGAPQGPLLQEGVYPGLGAGGTSAQAKACRKNSPGCQ